jgi:hypothetical protein
VSGSVYLWIKVHLRRFLQGDVNRLKVKSFVLDRMKNERWSALQGVYCRVER